jgi:ATP-dependent Lhr-like helicase
MVLCRRAILGELEPLALFNSPYDVAIHQIAGLLVETTSWKLEDLYSLLKRAYPYSTMNIETLKMLLNYMMERYPRLLYFNEREGIIRRARDIKPLFDYYFENLSMIPDEKQYLVIADGDKPVGVLDEAFVSEYGEIGIKFVEAGRCWKIQQIYENKVYVSPEEDPTGAVPSWVGDEIPVPLEVALEVGSLRKNYAERISSSKAEEFIRWVCEKYPIDEVSAIEAFKEVMEQNSLNLPIPSDRLITIERWDRYVIIQASFGHRVNRVLARVIAYLLSERIGQSVAVHQDPYRIILEADVSPELVQSILLELLDNDLYQLAKVAVERSGIFKRRLIHVGKKCGAIAKDADYASVSISGLIETSKGTPVFEESINTIFHDDFDIDGSKDILSKIARKEIQVSLLKFDGLSPIARIGMEEVSRRGEIVSPSRLRALIRQSTEARVLDSFLVAVCTDCWEYIELKKVSDLKYLGNCPRCRKESIGFSTEAYERIFRIAMKARSRAIEGKSLRLVEALKKSAALKREHGYEIVMLLAGRGIRLVDTANLITKKDMDIIDRIIEGEREALQRRYFASSS